MLKYEFLCPVIDLIYVKKSMHCYILSPISCIFNINHTITHRLGKNHILWHAMEYINIFILGTLLCDVLYCI